MCKPYLFLSYLFCFFIITAGNVSADYCEEQACCPTSCWMPYPLYGEVSVAYDTFRCLPEGSFVDNSGAYLSANFASPVPFLSDYGLGMQLGGSYGIYDWSGRASNPIGNPKTIQQQGFLTTGFFRTTEYCSGLNVGVVYDWMFNQRFGVFAVNPTFSQVRFKVGYLFDSTDEFGFWGTTYATSKKLTTDDIPLKFRAISQINLFWQHYFCTGAQSMIWAGLPYTKGLMYQGNGRRGRAGNFIIGANFNAPLNECWSVNGHAVYLRPHSATGISESKDYGSNVSIGLTYSFGCMKACASRPYLPIADNSNFLADTNFNF